MNKLNKENILNLYKVYTTLDPDTRRRVTARGQLARLRDGDSLVTRGEQVREVVFLGAGHIRVFLCGPNGREVTLYRLCPGELCTANILAAMNGGIVYACAAADGPVEMVTLPVPEFKQLFATCETLRELVFEAISVRTQALLSLIEGITFVRMESRVADYLMKRCVSDEDGQPVVKTTHSDIATDLGSAREVVSRVLKEFKARGAVDVARKQIKLLETGVLKEISEYAYH